MEPIDQPLSAVVHAGPQSPLPINGTEPVQPMPQPLGALPPCWNEAGVYGANHCPELKQFIHCRNCPVYIHAATQLLDRLLPRDYRRQATAHFAAGKTPPEPGNASVILFRLGLEWLALPTQSFQEVAERRPIHSLPHRPQGIVLGLANIRGELLICVSLGHLLNLKTPLAATWRTHYHRLLVTHWNSHRFAIPVDEVRGPHRFHPQELKTPPATVAGSHPTFTHSTLQWQQQTVGLLDAGLLFDTLNRRLT
ncbi:MAG TPA: chemotaxis protein CheW [Candidatus Sulfotelmatobacter sp.]|nr:chemotaxis protein CheW [Candidatus Sulfotelmatobacter sp.]HWI58945.1 chemotaxis protein CheW [Bacillota bacterium]